MSLGFIELFMITYPSLALETGSYLILYTNPETHLCLLLITANLQEHA